MNDGRFKTAIREGGVFFLFCFLLLHLAIVKRCPHEVCLRSPVVPHAVLTETPKMIRGNVSRVYRERAVESSQGLHTFTPVLQERAQIYISFLLGAKKKKHCQGRGENRLGDCSTCLQYMCEGVDDRC